MPSHISLILLTLLASFSLPIQAYSQSLRNKETALKEITENFLRITSRLESGDIRAKLKKDLQKQLTMARKEKTLTGRTAASLRAYKELLLYKTNILNTKRGKTSSLQELCSQVRWDRRYCNAIPLSLRDIPFSKYESDNHSRLEKTLSSRTLCKSWGSTRCIESLLAELESEIRTLIEMTPREKEVLEAKESLSDRCGRHVLLEGIHPMVTDVNLNEQHRFPRRITGAGSQGKYGREYFKNIFKGTAILEIWLEPDPIVKRCLPKLGYTPLKAVAGTGWKLYQTHFRGKERLILTGNENSWIYEAHLRAKMAARYQNVDTPKILTMSMGKDYLKAQKQLATLWYFYTIESTLLRSPDALMLGYGIRIINPSFQEKSFSYSHLPGGVAISTPQGLIVLLSSLSYDYLPLSAASIARELAARQIPRVIHTATAGALSLDATYGEIVIPASLIGYEEALTQGSLTLNDSPIPNDSDGLLKSFLDSADTHLKTHQGEAVQVGIPHSLFEFESIEEQARTTYNGYSIETDSFYIARALAGTNTIFNGIYILSDYGIAQQRARKLPHALVSNEKWKKLQSDWTHLIETELLSYLGTESLGRKRLRICSQNLAMLYRLSVHAGRNEGKEEWFQQRELDFKHRFQLGRCDIIALQEVVGSTTKEAQRNIQRLAKAVSTKFLGYHGFVGDTNHKHIRNGFLINRDLYSKVTLSTFSDLTLPTLLKAGHEPQFRRAPVAATIELQEKYTTHKTKRLTLINSHLISKSTPKGDPTGTEWEVRRIEHGEALRRIATHLDNSQEFGLTFLAVDRNAYPTETVSRVLSGELELKSLRACLSSLKSSSGKISTQEKLATCSKNLKGKALLHSVLEEATRKGVNLYTHQYNKSFHLIDELYSFRREKLNFSKTLSLGSTAGASDHLLITTEVSLP